MSHYQICTRCIMDTSDPDIRFDENGVCNHCRNYSVLEQNLVFNGEEGVSRLRSIVDEIKRQGKNKRYDCIIGVSGGVDSTFVACKVKELGLRPLAVHLDNGWNTELAVSNVENVLKRLDIDLYTHVLDWEEFKDLQLSFLKASTPDLEIPTDHAIFTLIRQIAAKENIRYSISGTNIVTEGILPRAWSYGHSDWRYIRSVHKQFGNMPLKDFPHTSLMKTAYYRLVHKQKSVSILNYLDYNKKAAIEYIENHVGWRNYGGKHHESFYTRFIQTYILPKKFNIDKRRAHLSTLICSGQIDRHQALEEIQLPPASDEQLMQDREFVIKKFELTEASFEELMARPVKSYKDYPNNQNSKVYEAGRKIYRMIAR